MKTWQGVAIGLAFAIVGASAWIMLEVMEFDELRGVPCDEMLPEHQVREVVAAHRDMIERINAIATFDVAVVPAETASCNGKTYLIIAYSTLRERERIRKLIGGRRFFGVPVYWQNM